MLKTHRCDLRTRRQATFNLEALDDRLVLSAAAAGAVAGLHEHRLEVKIARHEARLDKLEARHEAKLAAKEAKQEARIAQLQASASAISAVTIAPMGSTAASASASASPTGVSAVGVDLLDDGEPDGRHDLLGPEPDHVRSQQPGLVDINRHGNEHRYRHRHEHRNQRHDYGLARPAIGQCRSGAPVALPGI